MNGKHTVVLLGSGASAASAFDLPTMKGFFAGALGGHDDLRIFLRDFYGTDDTSAYDLESVLAHIDLSRERSASWGYEDVTASIRISRLYESLLSLVRERLRIPEDGHCLLHYDFFRRLDPRDSIITLNYDLVADYVVRSLGTKAGKEYPDQDTMAGKVSSLIGEPKFMGGSPPALMPREREQGYYLKLHGSLDWLQCPTAGCPNNTHIYSTLFDRLSEGIKHGSLCRICGSSLQTLIIPPLASKRIDSRGRLAFIWNLALREVRDCQHVVVTGLSLAASDFELRWLLNSARGARSEPLESIDIVNRSVDDQRRVGDFLSISGPPARMHTSITDFLLSA